MEFLGDRSATGLLPAFQNERLESRSRQIEGSDQTVVTATDDDDVAFLGHGLGSPLEVFENLERREAPRSAHDAPSRVRSRSAHVEVLDGCAELGPSGDRPQKEELLQGKLALKDIAFGQAELPFQIEGRDNLPVLDDVADVR